MLFHQKQDVTSSVQTMNSKSTPPTAKEDKLHILMFPWLAFGHMIPFLELSKLVALKGHRITFVSTTKNIDRLPKLPQNLSSLITFVKIPLPKVEKLPENAESTSDLPYDKVKYLKMAYDQLEQPIATLLQQTSPDWVIYDFAPYWLAPVAAKLGISTAYFSILIATSLCFMGSPQTLMGLASDNRIKPEDFTVPPKWIPFHSTVAFRIFEINRIFDDVIGNDENIPATYRHGASVAGCDVVAVRSSYEFEPEWLPLLGEIYGKPVIPVGLLPPMPIDHDSDDDDEEWKTIKEWLDKQAKGSVVYVAFGSEAEPSQTELTEIALGLEQTGFPFFWALRKKSAPADGEEVELPDGFEERTKERGIVRTSWAPQLKILSHDSVGGFLTHSGWSSVVEAIQFQKPLILLMFLADQGLIARLLEEKKMGYSIPRDDRDGSFTRDSVADSVRLVMVEEKGKVYRDKIREVKGLLVDGDIQDKYLSNLLNYFTVHKRMVKEAK